MIARLSWAALAALAAYVLAGVLLDPLWSIAPDGWKAPLLQALIVAPVVVGIGVHIWLGRRRRNPPTPTRPR